MYEITGHRISKYFEMAVWGFLRGVDCDYNRL